MRPQRLRYKCAWNVSNEMGDGKEPRKSRSESYISSGKDSVWKINFEWQAAQSYQRVDKRKCIGGEQSLSSLYHTPILSATDRSYDTQEKDRRSTIDNKYTHTWLFSRVRLTTELLTWGPRVKREEYWRKAEERDVRVVSITHINSLKPLFQVTDLPVEWWVFCAVCATRMWGLL